ncbi:NUDIX hydrolase [Gorillibacterium timonense]|uniref:NUDIX hydrolase n=1 Tax=Gorillibacterium timonense TaxID=1689269 RepID=UPI00071C54C6|nr:NUDIX domain-containing protein [Gorillibacterium timonense]
MELLAIPGVGGIIEKVLNGEHYILIQERSKDDALVEQGLIEIPAGKIRQFENVFDCLRREIKEETGLDVIEIDGENDSEVMEINGYKVINYSPFNCAQNIQGYYPVMVQIFICRVTGQLLNRSNESKNIRWISINELEKKLINSQEQFYPMHLVTLRKYLNSIKENRISS